MEKTVDIPPATFESVWAALQETERIFKERIAESDRDRKEEERLFREKVAESDRKREEEERIFREKVAESDRERKEEERLFREKVAESDRKREEEERIFRERIAESDREREEYERISKEKIAESDRERKEAEARFDREMAQSRAEWEKRIKKLEELTGSWSYNHGSFAEEYFFNAFENGKQNFFGEQFDDIAKNISNLWQGVKDEFDIVLYNHTSVALIEVKYKAHANDIPKVLKKAKTFRFLFPAYRDCKIYLGLASLSFYTELEQECINQGIAIIKQSGEKIVINDAHLKVF